MKLITLISLLLVCTLYGQTTKKVLFLGNSYTNSNDLPGVISQLAGADGNTLTKDQNTPGGHRLFNHSTNATSLAKIAADDWDFVVLQDQSQYPSFPASQVALEVYPYAEILSDSIKSNNACSVPLFYNTWGRRDGDPQWDSINTFDKMNMRLFNAYNHMANVNEGMLSPVGVGFKHIFDDPSPEVAFTNLYVGDGSHPTVQGTYLAACIFYNVIYGTTSGGNTYFPAGVTQAEADYIQGVADHVVYEVDSVRIDYRALSYNTFSANVSGNEVTVTSDIQNGTFDHWDFGDGTTSANSNDSHTYSGNGAYNVVMHTSNSCYSDSMTVEVLIGTGSLKENQNEKLNIYPNPSMGEVIIKMNEEKPVLVYSMTGELIKETQTNKTFVLESGIYVVVSEGRTERLVVNK